MADARARKRQSDRENRLDWGDWSIEEQRAMHQIWASHVRQQRWLKKQAKQRRARWTREEREWFEMEEAAKQQRLRDANTNREVRESERRTVQRRVKETLRAIWKVESYGRDSGYRRHPREDARDLEKAG